MLTKKLKIDFKELWLTRLFYFRKLTQYLWLFIKESDQVFHWWFRVSSMPVQILDVLQLPVIYHVYTESECDFCTSVDTCKSLHLTKLCFQRIDVLEHPLCHCASLNESIHMVGLGRRFDAKWKQMGESKGQLIHRANMSNRSGVTLAPAAFCIDWMET